MKMRILALPVLALGLSGSAPYFGPPTLCVPLDIGDAETIPTLPGDRPDKSFPISRLAPKVLGILEKSPDAEVHFETLRRTGFRLMSDGRDNKATKSAALDAAQRIDRGLVERLLRLESREGSPRGKRALAWFDLGLHRLNMRICGLRSGNPDWALFDKAERLAPEDPFLRLGLFAANYGERTGRNWERQIQALMAQEPQLAGRTRSNLMRLAKHFLGIKDLAELRKRYPPTKKAGKS